jgi:hypothetical protein
MEKTKKESKFNGAKIARQAEKSLKAVFPKGKFFVSSTEGPVEICTLDSNGYTTLEFNTFRQVFCVLTKIEVKNLVITEVERKGEERKKPALTSTPAPAK